MAETAINKIVARAAADPGVRNQAVKDLHKFCSQFAALYVLSEDFALAADIDTAHRAAQAKVDALLEQAAEIEASTAADAAAAKLETQAAVEGLRAEAGKLEGHIVALRRREKALAANVETLDASTQAIQQRLDELENQKTALTPIVEEAAKAEARLLTAQGALAQIEDRIAELRRSLGVA